MEIPKPVPGLVVRYAYLWREEHLKGFEEGQKDRPAVVVLSILGKEDTQRVVVAPVTHTPPSRTTSAIELPLQTKERLGLDDDRSWVVLDEVNVFNWPGPDLRRVPGKTPETTAYGLLPARMTKDILTQMQRLVAAGTLLSTRRSE